ncbi:TetR/AcrR family transcriptional regulator [Microlunatus sp. GCM10028923]|uniref:TetR/AcrR family transcriptional regulator n=1 Tax=Microlunatus sp. GCM10028923 TaxID=3273400 RepID=UPI00360AF1B0
MGQIEVSLVEAAIAAARDRDQAVAEVPLEAIAQAAGISRSTLLRRLGGSRAALDEAVRDAGVDPGGRLPVRERAVAAAARLIADRGLGSVTLASVADEAGCSLPAVHAAFDGRDSLLGAVFDRHSPLPELIAVAQDPPAELEQLVHRIYRTLITVLHREPRVFPALLSDLLSRPAGPAAELMRHNVPKLVAALTALLGPHQDSGALRSLPFPILLQLLIGPMLLHVVLRPGLESALPMPPIDEAAELFAAAFLRAAGTRPD